MLCQWGMVTVWVGNCTGKLWLGLSRQRKQLRMLDVAKWQTELWLGLSWWRGIVISKSTLHPTMRTRMKHELHITHHMMCWQIPRLSDGTGSDKAGGKATLCGYATEQTTKGSPKDPRHCIIWLGYEPSLLSYVPLFNMQMSSFAIPRPL